MAARAFIVKEKKRWQTKRKANICSFGDIYLNCLVLFSGIGHRLGSQSTDRSLRDLADTPVSSLREQ